MYNPYERLKDSAWSENHIRAYLKDENDDKIMSGGEDSGFDYVDVKSSTSRDWVKLDDAEMKQTKRKDLKSTDKVIRNVCRKIAAITIGANIPAEGLVFDENTQFTPQQGDQNTSKLVNFYQKMWSLFTSELLEKINDNTLFIERAEKSSSSTQDTSDGAHQEAESQGNVSPMKNG